MIFIILIILILLIFAINLKKNDKKILLIILSLIVVFLGYNLHIDYQIGKDIKNQIEYQKAHNADSI